jgi:hypothetical protein
MKNTFYKNKFKRGVSVIVGYVLLITFTAVIGVLVFQWIESYTPKEEINCPYGSSLIIQNYTCSSNILTFTIRNDGKFDIGGYLIYATDSPEEELAVIDISKNNTENISVRMPTGVNLGPVGIENALKPNDEEVEIYNLTGRDMIYSIEIVPLRWQREENKKMVVACRDVKIKKRIECS